MKSIVISIVDVGALRTLAAPMHGVHQLDPMDAPRGQRAGPASCRVTRQHDDSRQRDDSINMTVRIDMTIQHRDASMRCDGKPGAASTPNMFRAIPA